MEEKVQQNQSKREEMIEIYTQRVSLIKSKFPEISTAPASIQQEYYALNTLIDSLKTSRREIHGKTVSSDGCEIDKFVMEKYENALEKYTTLNKENEQYITPEEEKDFKKAQEERAQIDVKIDTYIHRQAVIKSKFPEISEAPASIQQEYYALNTLIDSLKTSRREIRGRTTSSDGYPIDGFVAEKYENALENVNKVQEENRQYVSIEDEENFQYPEIDFNGLIREARLMKTREQYNELYGRITELGSEPLPEATKARLSDIQKQMNDMLYKGLIKEQKDVQEPQMVQPVAVTPSKFAQIYQKAKGRIRETFSKIKTMIKEKSKDKENDDKTLDDDEELR